MRHVGVRRRVAGPRDDPVPHKDCSKWKPASLFDAFVKHDIVIRRSNSSVRSISRFGEMNTVQKPGGSRIHVPDPALLGR
jgi:hypothetical protein